MQIRDVDWRYESWAFNDPCRRCRVNRLDHEPTEIRHVYRTPALPEDAIWQESNLWDLLLDSTGGTVERAIFRHAERESNGGYDAPLPPPKQRKQIRENLGITQESTARNLFVNRTTIARWERQFLHSDPDSVTGVGIPAFVTGTHPWSGAGVGPGGGHRVGPPAHPGDGPDRDWVADRFSVATHSCRYVCGPL